MLASAVVVPENAPNDETPSLKRRQSSISSENTKRPRLNTNLSHSSSHGSPPVSATAMSPPPSRRKSSAQGTDAAEEKKRGQRLFGGLLGTLSQTSAKPAHRKRDEIEKRQQEKIRQKDEELAEEKRKKRDQLDALRREEQKLWDEESMHIRHQNMRAMAHFLKTKTEPYLYYKPWELRPGEEAQVKNQIEDTGSSITRELAEHAARRGAETGMNEEHSPNHQPPEAPTENGRRSLDSVDMDEGKVESESMAADDTNMQDAHSTGAPGTNDAPDIRNQTATKELDEKVEEKPPNDDHGGEELVEGQEDDVIY